MNQTLYDFNYYEGDGSNYKIAGGYRSIRMKISRFLVSRKAYSIISKYKSNGTSLDIGCAYGFFADFLSKKGFQAHGCDISDFAISVAKKEFPHVKAFRLDIDKEHIPGNETYDIITAFDVMEHCKNHDFISSNINKSLKRGGLFLIGVPDSDVVPPEKQGDSTHVTFLNIGQWIDIFESKGLNLLYKTFFPRPIRRIKPYWGTNLILFQKQ